MSQLAKHAVPWLALAGVCACNAIFAVDDLSFDQGSSGGDAGATSADGGAAGQPGTGGDGGVPDTGGAAGQAGQGGAPEPPVLIEIAYQEEAALGSTVSAATTMDVPIGSLLVAMVATRGDGPTSVSMGLATLWQPIVTQVNSSDQASVAVFSYKTTQPLPTGTTVTADVSDATAWTRGLHIVWAVDAIGVDTLGTSTPSDPIVGVTTMMPVSGARSWLVAVTTTGATATSTFSRFAPFLAPHAFVTSGSSGAFFTHTAVGIDGAAAQFNAMATGPANIAAALVVLE